ncbi:MAG: pilus assembly protein [Alphaproteobacteria bacterium]|nr:MAG: pilus assembly protein [Alphaproteobacteria bacterium]
MKRIAQGKGFTAALRGLGRRFGGEGGNASLEFVILFPVIMTVFLSAFEVSVYLARQALLDRALDLAVRDLRLGQLDPPTQEELKRRVCNGGMIFSDCMNTMTIELIRVSPDTWEVPETGVTCVNRDEEIAPVVDFTLGQANDVMIVRACYVTDPFFATTPMVMDLPVDGTGAVQIVSASTYVNEP